jgi:RecB family endonuclease NucS
MLSKKKVSPVETQLRKDISQVFKDTYVFEFLNLPGVYSENDLQKGLVQNIKKLLLELGKDFTFIGEEYRLKVGGKDFSTDLLFFHRELRCLVAFELKIDDFQPEYLGKLNFYLEALDRDVKKKHENPSVGVLLCKQKDDEVVEYALSRSLSPTMISKYKTQLIDKKLLKKKLHELFQLEDVRQKNKLS